MNGGTVLNPSVNYDSPVSLRAYLTSRGLAMLKRHGQNFLINRQARERLVAELDAPEEAGVWEIGPGLGAMTALLLNGRRELVGFEIDRGFAAALRELFPEESGFRLVEGDVLKTWRSEKAAPYLFGNLPYNIAAALLATFIENATFFRRAVVTVQKETADRMVARPGSKNYSSFTVLCSSVYRCTRVMSLKPAAFFPEPRVESAAVKMEALTEDTTPLPLFFQALVRAAFASRRKTLRNNFEAFFMARSIDERSKGEARKRAADLAETILGEAGIDPKARAESLDISAFIALATAMEKIKER